MLTKKTRKKVRKTKNTEEPSEEGHNDDKMKKRSYPTKESFRQLLLAFHNDVNRRTGKPALPRSYLDKYEFSNFLAITQLFLNTMKGYRSHLGGGFSDTRRRDIMVTNIRGWVNKNYMYFS